MTTGHRWSRPRLVCGVAALTLALAVLTVAANSQDDLDVLTVIPQNYKLLLEISSFE